MKTMNYKTIIIATALILVVPSVVAQHQISRVDAVGAAKKVSISRFQVRDTAIQEVFCKTSEEGDTLLYEVKMRGGQSVLLSGDRRCKPILGVFENRTGLSVLRDSESIPIPLKMLIQGYERKISSVIRSTVGTNRNDPRWDTLLSISNMPTRTMVFLITSQWGPSVSNDGNDPEAYNSQTPVIDDCQSTAGSAAVAMGQLMYYWKYPNFRTSYYDFIDWCSMSRKLYTESECYEDQKKAIGTLLYECGIASHTEYGCDYSETLKTDVRDALKNYFHFQVGNYHPIPVLGAPDPPGVPAGQTDYINLTSYLNMLMGEIDDDRPMIGYSSEDGKKYFFLCDGYEYHGVIDAEFNFNWGWNGFANGLFSIYNLTPDDYSFSLNLEILVGIEPTVDMSSYENFLDLTIFYEENESLLATIPPYELVPGTSSVLMSADTTAPTARRTIAYGESSVYQAGSEIVLQPGFTAEWGSNFTARITSCVPCELEQRSELYGNERITISIPDSTITLRQKRREDATIFLHSSQMILFPNPTKDKLTVQIDERVKGILIYDLSGRAVFRWFVASLTETESVLDVGDIPAGSYILHVMTADGKTHIGRFVKN